MRFPRVICDLALLSQRLLSQIGFIAIDPGVSDLFTRNALEWTKYIVFWYENQAKTESLPFTRLVVVVIDRKKRP